ncbi:MAG: hypothetical protein ACSHYB_11380 [Roseibacillus sp.]
MPQLHSLSSDKSEASIQFQSANRWANESGQEYVVIENMERMDPFFLNIVGPNNHWLFCSSDGALTAGRESSETSLFPYYTVDKIIGNWNTTGPWTAIVSDGKLWNPFRPSIALITPTSRRIMKSPLGDEVVFDEFHQELELRFTYRWQFSKKFGFVRKAKLTNEGDTPRTMRMVDGLDNFLPSGVSTRMQLEYSCLSDAYKVSELESNNQLLVHRLAAGITDEPIPLECLKSTTVWTHGLGEGPAYLERKDAQAFLRDTAPESRSRTRAKRGAFFLAREITLQPGETQEWLMVAEIEQTQSDVSALQLKVEDIDTLVAELNEDITNGQKQLHDLVASTDGFQQTADRDAAHYHYHNALCNILRGGIPENGYTFQREQFVTHLTVHNRELATKHAEFLATLPQSLDRHLLLSAIDSCEDSDLLRIAQEYLPLVLSRRHGDPSRPWNKFFIRVEDEAGKAVHAFQGNWRDIFQNWEALAMSYPDFLGSFIAKFLNASTIDGFNPYRITSDGIEWEAPDEDDPWASIGYWGDHQIVYLLKLLELEAKIHPESLGGRLDANEYVFTDVPYRLKGWEETLKDPRDTVLFDREQHDKLLALQETVGADGLLLRDQAGDLVRATLFEKLLVPATVKLANLIPGGGVWMNTQRPEWNDANNALAGCGLSVVTTGYLYRYLGLLEDLVNQHPGDTLTLSQALSDLVDSLATLFADERWNQEDSLSAEERFTLSKAAGLAAENHRSTVYQGGPGEAIALPKASLQSFLASARAAVKNTLNQNRRPDGLWHSYNILDIALSKDAFEVEPLSIMLEGQVSILTSGILSPTEALSLLESLPDSPLRSERHPTYLLYPDRELPSFLEKNLVSVERALAIPLLQEMDRLKDTRILVSDPNSSRGFRFHPSLTNSYALHDQLNELAKDAWLADLVKGNRIDVEELYEATFNHRSFTGRSGSMFGYEGLGCIYWHMISKLMLAAQEVTLGAVAEDADAETVARLTNAYYHVQSGLGFRQSPEGYGAFPSEPYSHSPGHAGAQQPGLTGQVKEGILARFGELGVFFKDGKLHFRPHLLRASEFAGLPASPSQPEIPVDTLSFTLARTPITYLRETGLEQAHATVYFKDGTDALIPKAILNQKMTQDLVQQTERIQKIEVHLPANWLLS